MLIFGWTSPLIVQILSRKSLITDGISKGHIWQYTHLQQQNIAVIFSMVIAMVTLPIWWRSHTGQHLCSFSIYSSILALTCTEDKNQDLLTDFRSNETAQKLQQEIARYWLELNCFYSIKREQDMKLDLSIIQFSRHYKNADCRMP